MNIPELIPVSSSNIESVGYDAENEFVFIKYTNQSIYVYKGVSQVEYENLLYAPSVGSYMHRNFKNVYPYERIS
ncbi:KTSC domain-containing protein [Pedobacter xixiisoli]|uniref:KTSC domain-containing protein n=1 Tax=Pedobacter xixiisoli TaxID=1476464 RepID=A0A285ZRH8_9SPHI|nr:KTSC domain-containing protein [Pedobacter xixiisoli]SOD12264.1 KTSC domain-containing protein [Pedobacter xixiisoli]